MDYIFLTLSATPDDSHPTYFVFSPQPAGITVPEYLRPLTCYIQVNVCAPSNDIRIAPQNAAPNSHSTKFGLHLGKNITGGEKGLIRQLKRLAIMQKAHHRGTPTLQHHATPVTRAAAAASSSVVQPSVTTIRLLLFLRSASKNNLSCAYATYTSSTSSSP